MIESQEEQKSADHIDETENTGVTVSRESVLSGV